MYRAIIVDDEILVREHIRDNIDWNMIGFDMINDCENGKEAIEFLERNGVDLVLTDINMPYLDGLKLSKHIHENFPDTKIVILSGYDDFQYAKAAIQYNVTEYLLKPITPKELIESLKNVKEKLDEERKKLVESEKLKNYYADYTRNRKVIKSNWLSNLVKGTKDSNYIIENLKDMDVNIHGKYYCLVVLDADVKANIHTFNIHNRQDNELLHFVVENISDEILQNKDSGVSYREIDGKVCLILFSDKVLEFKNVISDICYEIKHMLYKTMEIAISIGVGCQVDSVEDLYDSYKVANQMLEYKYLRGEDIYWEEEVKLTKEREPLNIDKEMDEISEYIQRGNVASVIEAVDNMKNQFQEEYLDKTQVISYLNSVIRRIGSVVLKHCGNLDSNDRDLFIAKIVQSESLEDACDQVNQYAEKMCEKIIEINEPHGSIKAKLAIQFLKQNYSNPNLGLSDVCNYLGISTSHFSNIFKEAMGVTCMEALMKIRMEEAKRLLIETQLRNYEIADRVGFSDAHYFNIAFKKAVGMAPKQYAKENKESR